MTSFASWESLQLASGGVGFQKGSLRPCDAMLDISSPALILFHKRAMTKGMKPVSQETRAKMSAARKGMKLSAQHRANISAGCKGLKRSAEARANISAGHKGKPRPELRGRKLSREHIAKISAFHKGRKLPEATRAKMRAARFAYLERTRENSSYRRRSFAVGPPI
ncbi:MAG: NUMOD3 domain-containing DNA-binding protein [Pseudolabrys sp.]